VQGGKRPHHTFHEGQVQRLVVVFEIDPTRLSGDVLLPLTGVFQDRIFRRLIEGGDTHLLDLAFVGNT